MIKVVDARTGKGRWSRKVGEPLPGLGSATLHREGAGIVHDGREGLVLVHYYASECTSGMCHSDSVEYSDEEGVAALSIVDGAVKWHRAIIPAVRSDTDKARRLRGMKMLLHDGLMELALVKVTPVDGAFSADEINAEDTRSVALDPKTGKPVWTAAGVAVWRFAGECIAAMEPVVQPDGAVRFTGGPLALDPQTGKEIWKRTDLPDSTIQSASNGLMSVQSFTDGAVAGQVLLSLADGTTQASLPGTPEMIGDAQGDLVAAYSIVDRSLVTFAPGEEEPIKAAQEMPDGTIQVVAVHGGYILATTSGNGAGDSVTVVDRSGNVLGGQIPGVVTSVDDTALVTVDKSGGTTAGYNEFSVFLLR